MDEEQIKNAFAKVKQDIYFLSQQIAILSENLEKITGKNTKNSNFTETDISTKIHENQALSTNLSTMKYPFKPLKHHNLAISTGNQGVSTDRQTDRHIDNNPPISSGKTGFYPKKPEKTEILDIDQAADILDSLDQIKKEIRLKFKRLTEQEMLIFSAIYQLEEERGYADYRTIANILNISESSTRDHVGKIIKKGVPVEKRRENNKKIKLYISQNLKKITSLSTILQLRDI